MNSVIITDPKTTLPTNLGLEGQKPLTSTVSKGEPNLQANPEPVTAQVPNLYLFPPCPPELAKPTFRAPIAR